MAKTIAALYESLATAQQVVNALIEAGFSGDDISVLVRNAAEKQHQTDMLLRDVTPPEGVGFGAMIGALVGIGTFLLPGVGPLIGAGPLAVAISAGIGAAAGAVTGGVTAALLDLGVNEQDALFLAEGVRRGGTLVSLTTQEQWLEWAENIMKRYRPISLEEHVVDWSRQNITTFAPSKRSPKSEDDDHRARIYRSDFTVSG